VLAKPGTNILVSLQFIGVNGIFFNVFFGKRLTRPPKEGLQERPMYVNQSFSQTKEKGA
jgi:hypothetical protein